MGVELLRLSLAFRIYEASARIGICMSCLFCQLRKLRYVQKLKGEFVEATEFERVQELK